ncbi:MAG: peptidylprolyl isomerase [Candidatus Krumholzibacteriota bacterium]|nr:peptidylprolyl isomerase [Candidatus Krumholzibacteriota bacterium]
MKNWKLTGSSIVLLLISVIAFGCARNKGEKTPELPPGAIVRVGDVVLTHDKLENLLPESEKIPFSPEEKTRFIQNWVDIEIFYNEALRRGLQKDPRVSTRILTLKKEFLADHLVFLELRDRINVSEEEVEGYFMEHGDEYKYEYRVSHILVNTFEEAEEAEKLLKNNQFAWVANRYSVDPMAKRGGDLGYLTKGNMIPEFETVIFDLKPGEVSQIVESDFGFHLIKMVGMREARVKVTLDEVRERIMSQLIMEKRAKTYSEFETALRESADIEYYEKNYMPGSVTPVEIPVDRDTIPEGEEQS